MKKNSSTKRKKIVAIFSGHEKDYFAENLAMLLSAGIGVSAAIVIMSEGAHSKSYKRVLLEMSQELDEGVPLWKALTGRGVFTDSYIYMTKVGEASGRLSENLAIIAEQDRKNRSFNSKLSSALIYPGIILSLTFIIGIGVSLFVIPNMAKIFKDMRLALPLPTQILIGFGDFIANNLIIFISLIIGFVVFVAVIFFVPKTQKIGQAILLRIPTIRNLFKEVEIARFSYVMYSLSKAGVPLTEALLSVERSTTIASYQKLYHFLYQNVNDGVSLQKCFVKYKDLNKLIPINIQQMIIAGENSGNFISIMDKISQIYEEKIDITSKNLTVIIEPVLLIIVAVGVLFLALSIFMPIYGLVGGLNA